MAKRQRSSFLFEPPPRAPWHRVLRNSVGSTSVDRRTWRLFSAENIRSAVQDLIAGCTAGVWLRILPLDEDDDSLCFHTGQEWADIQPCLQECGLLTTPGNIGGKLIAPTQVWEDFAVASAGVFEVGTARPKAGTRPSIFVMRKPKKQEERMYRCPIDQVKDQLKSVFEVKRLARSPCKSYFRHCRIHLLSVEKEHVKKTYHPDSLTRSVKRAWDERLNPIVFSRVADRLLKVLDLIVKDGGDNNLVESERGKLFSDPIDAPAEDVANDSDAPEAPDFVLDNEDE